MRNLKKVLSVLLVVVILATAMVPVFAAPTDMNTAAAQTLYDLGLFKGTSPDKFVPELEGNLTREQGITLLVRLLGAEKDAKALTAADVDAALKVFTDAKDISVDFKNTVAYAVKMGLVNGTTATTMEPAQKLTGNMLATMILKNLGAKDVKFETALATLADALKLPAAAALKANTELLRNDFVLVGLAGLQAKLADGKTVIEALIAKGVVTKEAAVKAGVYTMPVVAALDVKSAVAINSKVVEVALNTAVTAVNAADITVKDAAGTAVAVAKAELAPWSADGKSVLVTLGADTTAGTLYTLTAATKSVNFGGKAVDSAKPEVKSVTVNDYNKITFEFTEAVKFDAATIVLAEKYGSKTALNVVSTKYNGSTKIVVMTDEQKGSTLYGYTVTGVVDMAGNTMDKKEDTFIGTAKPTDVLKVTGAKANNPEEMTIAFNVNVDPATIKPENFKVEEMYGTKAVLAVQAARLANKDELATDGTTKLTDTTKTAVVVLTVAGTKDSTLYKVTVSGMKTLYGKDLSTTASETFTTAVGSAKPTTVFTYAVTGSAATSNTTVELVFDRKVVKADAENVANYAINEAYADKAALTITSAVLKDDGKTLTLTTTAEKTVLYKLTVSNIKDIYGNALKTESNANVTNFSGIAVAAKISNITEISYVDGSTTEILVTFDQNVGANATDVSLYTVDNNGGYPEKVATQDNKKQVKLTLPKLTDNKTYKLTVKGLTNADGVAMGTDGVSASFLGKGNTSTLPELVAVMAVDNQTLKVFFDRDVTDAKIKGIIWDSNLVKASALTYTGATANVDLAGKYAFQDADNKNVLVVRVDTDAFKAANKSTTTNAFTLTGTTATMFAKDKNTLMFAPMSDAPAKIVVDAVMALNKKNIRVYFNQPVYGSLATFADINTTKTNYGATGAIALSTPVAVDATKKVYDFAVGADLTASSYWLNLNVATVVSNEILTDRADKQPSLIFAKDEETTSETLLQHRQFAGSGAAVGDVKEISVIMTDARTITVYFPTAMDAASVKTAVNYTVYKADGTTLAVMNNGTADSNFAAADIAKIAYDGTQNMATITLNKAVKDITSAKLAISKNVKNATLTASVVDGENSISKLFAIGTAAAAKVTVTGATYDAKAGTLKVTFSQPVINAPTTDAEVAAALKITYRKADGTEGTIVATDVVSATPTAADGVITASSKDVVIKLTPASTWKAEGVGKVQIKALTGINGMGADTDATFSFAQK